MLRMMKKDEVAPRTSAAVRAELAAGQAEFEALQQRFKASRDELERFDLSDATAEARRRIARLQRELAEVERAEHDAWLAERAAGRQRALATYLTWLREFHKVLGPAAAMNMRGGELFLEVQQHGGGVDAVGLAVAVVFRPAARDDPWRRDGTRKGSGMKIHRGCVRAASSGRHVKGSSPFPVVDSIPPCAFGAGRDPLVPLKYAKVRRPCIRIDIHWDGD